MQDDLFFDIKSGSAYIHGDTNCDLKFYAVVVRGGHVGSGYCIPVIATIMARNKETAIKIAENIGGVKKAIKHIVLAIEEVNEIEYYALEYINDCDPYINNKHNTKLLPEVMDRRVILPSMVDKEFKNTKHYKGDFIDKKRPNYSKVPKELVKTADQYDDIHVLQRHLAPTMYGDKLIFPSKLNLRSVLGEYLEKNLYELGVKQLKASAMSFYYQLFGLHNRPGLYYKDKCLVFYDHEGKKQYIKVPNAVRPYLDKAKKKFMEEEMAYLAKKEAENNNPTKDIVLPSKREKFKKRYAKYQQILQSKVK